MKRLFLAIALVFAVGSLGACSGSQRTAVPTPQAAAHKKSDCSTIYYAHSRASAGSTRAVLDDPSCPGATANPPPAAPPTPSPATCETNGTCDWCGADVCYVYYVGDGAGGVVLAGCGTDCPDMTKYVPPAGSIIENTFGRNCALIDPNDPTNDPSTGNISSSARHAATAGRSTKDLGSFCRTLWSQIRRWLNPPQVYPLYFREDHFVVQHLQGVVNSPVQQVEAAISMDIQLRLAANNSLPEAWGTQSQQFQIPFNDQGTPITIAYRVYYVASGNYLSVGTVFVP